MTLLKRGVYRAPCLSPKGEVILFAVDHAHRRIENGIIYLREEDDFLGPIAALWRMLDAQDPEYARRQEPRHDPKPTKKILTGKAIRASVALLPLSTAVALLSLIIT